ncbi:ribosomal RNA small subunit methyltransferase H, partial [Striga asiatica]
MLCATQKLPDALTHQYTHLIPVECTLTTREGRMYNVVMRAEPRDLSRVILDFGEGIFELQIVEGHGKVLMQNWGAEAFVDLTDMVEGSTWCFKLIPYFCVRFEKTCGNLVGRFYYQ